MKNNDYIRAFISIEISDELKNKIAEIYKELAPISIFIKWTKPENIHITLKFFADFPLDKLELLFNVMEKTVSGLKPFSMKISGLGAFPNWKHPRVIWIGIVEGAAEAQKLQLNLNKCLRDEGFEDKEENSFTPHLTIARVKDFKGINKYLGKINVNNPEFENIGMQKVDNIKFIRSVLTPSGPQYTCLKTIPID